MHIPRIYYPKSIKKNKIINLKNQYATRINDVLRMHIGEKIELFNGNNFIYIGIILEIQKKIIKIQIEEQKIMNKESKLFLHLGQVLCKKKKMEFIIQKSIESGVNIITPIITQNSNFKINFEKFKKKYKRWKKIVISSCEQCGRNKIPLIRPIMSFKKWCSEKDDSLKIIFNPSKSPNINLPTSIKKIRLLIGPESGFSNQEKKVAEKNKFMNISLGPRILRTETAALIAITGLQIHFGDFLIGKKNV